MKTAALKENLSWLYQVIAQQMGKGYEGNSPKHVIPSWRWALENAEYSSDLSPWRLTELFNDPMLVELREFYKRHPERKYKVAITYEEFVFSRHNIAERYLY
jgi:hypothetical protein